MIGATLRLSTPLILAALGGLFSERSGIINIALEGMMLIGAFSAVVGNLATGSPWGGLTMAMGASTLLALLHATVSIHGRANQVVSGMAINILAFGLAPLLSKALYDSTGTTPTVELAHHFSEWSVPGLGSQTPLVVIALILVIVVHLWYTRTASGLRFRAVGEHPSAADSVGLHVYRIRYMGLALCGALCGMAGAFLSIGHGSNFSRGMTAGRGFIALTALIFGKWRPIPTFFACLLFGFADALQMRMQGAELPFLGQVPPQFVQILPYVVTLVVLAGFIGRARPPRALGMPYIKEE